MPLNQSPRLPLPNVRHYRKVLHLAAILKQLLLPLPNANRHIAQRLRIFVFRFLPRHKAHLGAFAYLSGVRFPVALPALFVHLEDRLVPPLHHPRTDPKPDESPRTTLSLFVPQPIDQVTLVARRIAPIIVLRHGLWQRRIGLFGHCQRRHHRRHVSIPKLIRQHHVHPCPYRPHRLIASLSLVGSQGLLLSALDDGGILVHRGDALLGAAPPQLPHQFPIDQP